jgi:type II secretory pathway component PulK
MEKMHSDDERGKFDLAALVVSKREREEDKERRRGDILKLSLCGGYYYQ